ncbi:MAG: hypothetical protein IPJ41_00915 [Phycisphaerales bacterium]|nr:hypothetical protein [Phycisphaerales bacterium]
MTLKSRMWAAGLCLAAVVVPSIAQVTTPPPAKPEAAPEYRPPAPPPPPRERPARTVKAPDVDFVPLSRRDDSGKIIPVTEPVEYVAMSHNPLIDVPKLVKIAPYFYTRRQVVEAHIIDNLDALENVEAGAIENTRMADEEGLRKTTGRLMALTDSPDLKPFLSTELVEDGVLDPSTGALTQKIMQTYQQDLTTEAMHGTTDPDGATPIDKMMHVVIRMSVSEFEYYYRRLMLDAADQLPSVLPELALDAAASAKVKPLAAKLAGESNLDARAALVRQMFAQLPLETQQQALRLTVQRRPKVDASALMAPLPEGAKPRDLDDETRHEIIFQLMDGGKVNTANLVE